jgi:cytochrome c peroxidase
MAAHDDRAYVTAIAERGFATTQGNIDNGWVTASRLMRVSPGVDAPREAIALDARRAAVGDAEAVAVAPDGNTIAIAAGGTHELLLLTVPLAFVAYGGPGDHIDESTKMRRVALGGRPVAVVFSPDGKTAVVANWLANALQVVEVGKGALVRTIALGGAEKPSPARQGETLFYDATRSFGQWFSCHTCHVDGHTGGGLFDTFGDGAAGNPKRTPSLRGVTKTGPWTWRGAHKELKASIASSMQTTLRGPKPAEADLDALAAFLGTLEPAPPRGPADAEAAKRGETVFRAKNCHTCHAPPLFTTDQSYDVGLGEEFNPPSLLGVRSRASYLHDGRARTIEELLTKHHRSSKVSGKDDPTAAELADLIAFLKSL